MNIKSTPFSTSIFQKIWKNHFIPNIDTKRFKFISGINFYKNNFLPIYFNVGRNLTKGNSYEICDHNDYKRKTFIIYDVLTHVKRPNSISLKGIGRLKSVQYPGFLIDLNTFDDINDYMLKTFSKNTRMKMRKFDKRLSNCFNISQKMFFGHIEKHEYDIIFEDFMHLLKKRYSEKRVTYNNMQPSEWNFYKEVAYPLILQKKASLFVIYNNETPIAITYNYHSPDKVTDAITVFDTDYSKFNIGYVNNLKLLNWCFKNGIKSLDFSKGYFDYKKRMCTLEYNFEYHILYDKRSIRARSIAYFYYHFLELKKSLRKKKLDVKFHKLTYKLKNKKSIKPKQEFDTSKIQKLPDAENLINIDVKNDKNYYFLSRCVNDFLYLVSQPYEEIETYRDKDKKGIYFFSSNSLIHQVKLIN